MKRLGMILLAAAGAATAADAPFAAGSNVLTVPSLVVGNQRVSDVQVRLKTFDLISVGASTTVTNLPTTCTSANVNSANLAAVKALVVTDPTKVKVIGLTNIPLPGYQTIDINTAIVAVGCKPNTELVPLVPGDSSTYQYSWNNADSPTHSITITNFGTTISVVLN
jgi:hypothetical protein